MTQRSFKSGFVVIAGRPNVGKSTILNWFMDEKLAIVSTKPETTRDNIKGILALDNAQIILIDTPGIRKAQRLFDKKAVKKAKTALPEADLILTVIDAASGIQKEDQDLIDMVEELKVPSMLLLNKVDAISKSRLLPMIKELSEAHHFLDIFPISALRGDNMESLKKKIIESLQEGEKYYPDEQLTDKDIGFLISELIREKVLGETIQEVPHSVAVKTEEISERKNKNLLYIKATIYVERPTQKAIIIGHKGEKLKKIGSLSRKDIEVLMDKRVYLDLWVKVLKNWRNSPNAIRMLGLE